MAAHIHRRRQILFLLAGTVILRLVYMLLFVDLGRDYYWEYGEIAKNLLAGNGYALHHLEGETVSARFVPGASPVPSAFMPPGYVLFLTPFLAVDDVPLRNVLLVGTQSLLAAGAVLLIFQLTRRVFGETAAIAAALLAAVLPEFIYAVGSYTPTVLFHLLIAALLTLLYGMKGEPPRATVAGAAVLGAALIALRSETALFVVVCSAIIMRVQGWKRAVLFVSLVVLLHAPWLVRNTVVFGEMIPFTTSGGLNFFRGHNAVEVGAWHDSSIVALRSRIPMDTRYEPTLDSVYWNRALDHVKSFPLREAEIAVEKFRDLWWMDPMEPRTASWLYAGPWVAVLGLAAFGLVRARPWRNHLPILLFLGYCTVVAIVFFVLPRYQTMMKIALLPLAGHGLAVLLAGLRRRRGGPHTRGAG